METPARQKWEGRWEQLAGRVKRLWGRLLADEHLQLEGEMEVAIGAHHEQVGLAREEFQQRLDQRLGR